MNNILKAGALAAIMALTACETVPKNPTQTTPETPTGTDTGVTSPNTPEATAPNPDPVVVPPISPQPGTEQSSGETISEPISAPPAPSISISESYRNISGWGRADFQNALKSFQRGCSVLVQKDPSSAMHSRSDFGKIGDWLSACNNAQATPVLDNATARAFFESEFLPVQLRSSGTAEGLTTGYYQPEIQARRSKDSIYSEPILTTPTNASYLTLPRGQINESISSVIGYGRPIEVFFMQVQGSGVLVFEDGSRIRAAYDANNGRPYTSIGRVLVDRGAFSLEQASKQRIEDWMTQNGPQASRELMNRNTRYIFFKEERILPGEGPKGAMRVPLTDMASIAVDRSHYPYGLPVWLETKIPLAAGDYRGVDQQLLVITQDTGKAIRGPNRADLYFGSGKDAGDRAGVMKHTARWTVLLPFHLAIAFLSNT